MYDDSEMKNVVDSNDELHAQLPKKTKIRCICAKSESNTVLMTYKPYSHYEIRLIIIILWKDGKGLCFVPN